MADEPKLIVAVEARLDRFERQLRQAGLIAERELKNIEDKTSNISLGVAAGNLIASGIQKAMSGAVDEIKKVIDEMNKLNDTLKVTGISAEQFQRVASAGLASGLSTEQIRAGLDAVALKMNDINHGETELSKFLDKNNIKYKERNGLVVDANKALDLAATIMSRAGNEADKIRIAEKFGLSREWVNALGEGLDKWVKMKEAAAKVNPELERQLQHMKALNTLYNQLGSAMKGWGSSMAVEVLPAFETILTAVQGILQGVASVAREGFIKDSVVKGVERVTAALEAVQAGIKEANVTRIQVNKPGTVKGLGDDPDKAEKDALDKQFEALSKLQAVREAEFKMVGQTVAKQEEARQMALLMEAAKRAELEVDAEILAKMEAQAAAAGKITQQLAERNHQWQEMVSASKELGSIMSDAMKGMVLEGKKFDEVLKNIGNRLAAKSFDKLFDMLFAAPAGGGGSSFMKLIGLASGGPANAGQPYMVGERGPELFVPKRSGQIVPNTALSGSGGGMNVVGPTTNVVVQGSADSQTIGMMQQMLAARDRRFVADVAHATAELRRRSAFA